MITETSLSISTLTPLTPIQGELTSPLPAEYDAFCQAGGTLSRKDYQETVKYTEGIQTMQNVQPRRFENELSQVPATTKSQFLHMAELIAGPKADLTIGQLTDHQKVQLLLYGYLRAYKKNVLQHSAKTETEIEIAGKTARVSDQHVFADVLLLTAPKQDIVNFMSRFPNIFVGKLPLQAIESYAMLREEGRRPTR